MGLSSVVVGIDANVGVVLDVEVEVVWEGIGIIEKRCLSLSRTICRSSSKVTLRARSLRHASCLTLSVTARTC